MKKILNVITIILLILLGLVYASNVNLSGELIWWPGIIILVGLIWNWYLFNNLIKKGIKTQKK